MRIRCLFAQRKEQYPGEYGPELLVAVDQNTDDENPAYFTQQVGKMAEDEIVLPEAWTQITQGMLAEAWVDHVIGKK